MKTANIHASCVLLADAGAAFGAPRAAGVLLLGKSGAGKSDLALRLIAMGAVLVADDRTELFVRRGRLCARAPKAIAGLMEIRGAGVVALPFATQARVALAVELGSNAPRLPAARRYRPPASLGYPPEKNPPLLRLAPFEAATPAKIAAATAAFAKGLYRGTANLT